jgi:hypothetical protein
MGRTLVLVLLALAPAAATDPGGTDRRHVEEVTRGTATYAITHGGTLDGESFRSPLGGGFGVWTQGWESNRLVRLENVGDTDLVDPWVSNGRNDFRTVREIAQGATAAGMTDRERALAIWRRETTHRFHASAGDPAEMHDPVKVLNVYGYTTCGDDAVCLAGLWHAAGLPVSPGRLLSHRTSQVFYEGRWHLLDGDMGPVYLLRDNRTIASEQDLVRDHDLVKRSHPHGILDPDRRTDSEEHAALFVTEGEASADPAISGIARESTMSMVLRPHEAIEWRWGQTTPLKYHGTEDIDLYGPRRTEARVWGASARERICNGLWEYRPDWTEEAWRRGAVLAENIEVDQGALAARPGAIGRVVWRMKSPYVFVGGHLDPSGSEAAFSLSWDGSVWQPVGESLDPLFPTRGPARYEYWLKVEIPPGARLRRLAIRNDLQMAPLALPGMRLGENRFTYSDRSPGARMARITHEWTERSDARPPGAPSGPLFPADGGRTERTDIAFEWRIPDLGAGETIEDYHFELSDREDLAWPLSSNLEKLVTNTAERGQPRYRLSAAGVLSPGQRYFWHVRAKSGKGIWGPWGRTWSFTAGGPGVPRAVRLEPVGKGERWVLRWEPDPEGRKPVRYRIYGSDEKGFSANDEPYSLSVGSSREVSPRSQGNRVTETDATELVVLGTGIDLPNANKAFYRVVAIDDQGTRSGPSDYAAAPRPFFFGEPGGTARRGAAYRATLSVIRSLGDLRLQWVDGEERASFWDIERPRFVLEEGPRWLRVDERTGELSGVPEVTGTFEVALGVTLERTVRRLEAGGPPPWNLGLGKRKTEWVGPENAGTAIRRFRIRVSE